MKLRILLDSSVFVHRKLAFYNDHHGIDLKHMAVLLWKFFFVCSAHHKLFPDIRRKRFFVALTKKNPRHSIYVYPAQKSQSRPESNIVRPC